MDSYSHFHYNTRMPLCQPLSHTCSLADPGSRTPRFGVQNTSVGYLNPSREPPISAVVP